jgi:hypothetical protein
MQDQFSPAEEMKSSQYSVAESHIKLGPQANGCPASALLAESLTPSEPLSLLLSEPLASSLLALLPASLASPPSLPPESATPPLLAPELLAPVPLLLDVLAEPPLLPLPLDDAAPVSAGSLESPVASIHPDEPDVEDPPLDVPEASEPELPIAPTPSASAAASGADPEPLELHAARTIKVSVREHSFDGAIRFSPSRRRRLPPTQFGDLNKLTSRPRDAANPGRPKGDLGATLCVGVRTPPNGPPLTRRAMQREPRLRRGFALAPVDAKRHEDRISAASGHGALHRSICMPSSTT